MELKNIKGYIKSLDNKTIKTILLINGQYLIMKWGF
jgi:hypothetical protein